MTKKDDCVLPGHLPRLPGIEQAVFCSNSRSESGILYYSPRGALSHFPNLMCEMWWPPRFSFQSPLAKPLSPLFLISWLNWACSACAPEFREETTAAITRQKYWRSCPKNLSWAQAPGALRGGASWRNGQSSLQTEFPSGQHCAFPWNWLT